MGLRTVLAILVVTVCPVVAAADCDTRPDFAYGSGCGTLTLSAFEVKPGDTLTVTVSIGCQELPRHLSVSWAEPQVVVNGTMVTGQTGEAGAFAWHPRPAPDTSIIVDIPAGPSATAVFKIRQDAPFTCVQINGDSASGPWVEFQGNFPGSLWYMAKPLRILGPGLNLGKTANTVRPNEARPGETIEYVIQAGMVKDGFDTLVDTLTITDTAPPGTVLLPETVTPTATVSGQQVQWKFEKSLSREVRFSVKVNDASQLPANQTKISNTVNASATLASIQPQTKSVTVDTKLVRPFLIRGTVFDVGVRFPATQTVDRRSPVDGATVRLLDADESVLDSGTTKADGTFELGAPRGGVFTVEVQKKADRYTSASNDISPVIRAVTQRRKVTVDTSATGPTTSFCPTRILAFPCSDRIGLPVSLVNRMAALLLNANNLSVDILARVLPPPDDRIVFRLDTHSAEQFVETAIADADDYPSFPIVYSGSGPRDSWNAMIRLAALLAMLKPRADQIGGRFDESARMGEGLAKLMALQVTIEVMKVVMSAYRNHFDLPDPKAREEFARAVKISIMGGLLNRVLIPYIRRWVPPGEADYYIEILSKFLRFGIDLVTGQFAEDLVFEVVFQTLRVKLTQLYVGSIVFPDPILDPNNDRTFQTLLNNAVDKAVRKNYSDDTDVALTVAGHLHDQEQGREDTAFDTFTRAMDYLNWVRLVDGLYVQGQKVRKATTQINGGQLASILGNWSEVALIQLAPIAVAMEVPVLDLFTHPFATEAMALAVFHVPANTSSDDFASADAAGTVGPLASGPIGGRTAGPTETAAQSLAGTLRLMRLSVSQQPQTYMSFRSAVLQQLGGLLDAGNALDTRGLAVLGVDLGDTRTNAILSYQTAWRQASVGLGLLLAQLEAWSAEPFGMTHGSLLGDLTASAQHLSELASLASAATAAMDAITAPPTYSLDDPQGQDWVTPGSIASITLRITNVGDQATNAGSANFRAPAALTLHSGETQSVPALAPGASTDLVWLATVPSGAGVIVPYQVSVAAPNTRRAVFDGVVVTTP